VLGTFKITDMIHIINFLIKGIATLIFMPLIGFSLIILALIFWDDAYMDVADKIQNDMIWKKGK